MIGFIPSLPDLALDPDIIFLIFLPPLLYDAASQTSWHNFKADIRPISALAITLVLFTTIAVAVTAHYLVPNFGWPLAFLLGAIISPTDAVAASGIIRGLNLNRRVMTILEGESLVNDASALIAYRQALAAVLTGSFVFFDAGVQFLLVAGGGILTGIVVGYILVFVHSKINSNALVETGLKQQLLPRPAGPKNRLERHTQDSPPNRLPPTRAGKLMVPRCFRWNSRRRELPPGSTRRVASH